LSQGIHNQIAAGEDEVGFEFVHSLDSGLKSLVGIKLRLEVNIGHKNEAEALLVCFTTGQEEQQRD
jgi:hypothetical protein